MRISIIVCTRNRSWQIIECLKSIKFSLDFANMADAEIVVVDNGSTDDTVEQVKSWIVKTGPITKLLLEPTVGLAQARNWGMKHAQGTLIVFTDDDCRMSQEYITELLQYDNLDTDPVIRGGRVELGDISDIPLSINASTNMKRWHSKFNSSRHEWMGNCILGCNMAMRKSITVQIGQFDCRLGAGTTLPGGEDTDYIFRAYLADILIEYVPNLRVTHFHGRKTNEEAQRLMKNYAIGTGALYAKYLFRHANFCRPFYWDIKSTISEIISGKNNFMPKLGVSHTNFVYYCLLGFIKFAYITAAARTKIQ